MCRHCALIRAASALATDDPRSVTQTFAMWTATAPPSGFVWGYDSRSTTENYEQWLAAEAAEDSATPPTAADTEVETTGVPSVVPVVWSWYDPAVPTREPP